MKIYATQNDLNNYLEYFSIKSINHKIILNKKNPLINNIICDNYYVNLKDFKLQNNKIKIKFLLEFKILYSSLENNKTYTIKDVKIGYLEISLPDKINGEYLENIFLRNGFFINLLTLNPSIINFKKDYICIFLNIFGYLEFLEIHSIAYKIRFSDFEENIYTSLFNGKELTQRTFEINKTFKNLIFASKNNYMLYLEEDDFKTCIKKISLENEERFNLYENLFLKNYEIFDDNNILLLAQNIHESYLILFNMENFREKIFYKLYNSKITFFKITKNLIILIVLENDIKSLLLLDRKGNLIHKVESDFSCVNISPCESFLLLLEKNLLKMFFLNSKEIYSLNNTLTLENIINFKFLTSKRVLLHVKSFEKELLLIINLSNNNKEILFETTLKVIDFSIDYEKNLIFYVLKNYNICEIYTINENKEIKNILNLNAKNISLTIRS